MARVWNADEHPLVIAGKFGSFARAEESAILAFNISSVMIGNADRFVEPQVDFNRLGKFLNALGAVIFPFSYTNPIMVIDNRASAKSEGHHKAGPPR